MYTIRTIKPSEIVHETTLLNGNKIVSKNNGKSNMYAVIDTETGEVAGGNNVFYNKNTAKKKAEFLNKIASASLFDL